VENPFEGYRRLPRLVDLLGYHVEEWDYRISAEEKRKLLRQAQEEEEEEEE
jgi:hypothetical protein